MKEYKVISIGDSRKLESTINKMAVDNWELKTLMERSTTRDIHIVFERNKD